MSKAVSPVSLLRRAVAIPALAGLALLLGACDPPHYTVAAPASSFVITNARVVDGSGKPARAVSVRIDGDTIAELGELELREGETAVDAGGLVLAPGFIDSHSHHDRGLRAQPDALPLLTQGITTAVFGQDGSSALPLQNYLDDFAADPAAVSIASYVGHNTLRNAVMGDGAKREATSDEIAAMQALLEEEMRAGALGLSTGLEYEPGIYSATAEVLALARTAAGLGGRYISHLRSEDRHLWDAVDEIITIGRETGMPVQISHMKLAAKSLWGQSARLLAQLDAARAAGIDITADVYPYEYWESTMWVLLPERNADDLEEIAFVLRELTPADGIIFTHFAPNPDYVGMSVAGIAAERGSSEIETFSDLLKEAEAWSRDNDDPYAESIMGRSMSEGDIRAFLAWPHANICSDGGYTGHPRGHGAFPRVLARYVREGGILSLENAIAAMTSRTADHLGLADRGRIAAGYKADLVLFDPAAIRDNAGLGNGQALSTGVSSVWVNGQLVLDDGRATGAYPGAVLQRQRR